MQVRYEKDNKERIPFEHYLEEFAAIDPKEAAARVGVPWHEENPIFNKGCALRRHRKVSDLSGSAAWRSLLPSV